MSIPGDGECKQIEAELRSRSRPTAGTDRVRSALPGAEAGKTLRGRARERGRALSPLQSLVVHQRLDLVHKLPRDLQDVLDVVALGHFCGMCTFI